MKKKIIRLTEYDLHNIIHETAMRMINENASEQAKTYLDNICNKLNQLANSVEGVNAFNEDLPERRYNYHIDLSDEEYYILYDIIDSDGNKDNNGECFTDYDSYDDVAETYACDVNAVNEFFKIQTKDLKNGIKYANTHRQMIIPLAAQKKLDKLNMEINSAIQEWGYSDIMLEEGDEGGFTAKNFRFEFDEKGAHLIYDTDNGTDEAYPDYGDWFYHMLDIYEFNNEELGNTIKWYRSCLKRGLKYLKEYNPDWDNDEEAREKFFNGIN